MEEVLKYMITEKKRQINIKELSIHEPQKIFLPIDRILVPKTTEYSSRFSPGKEFDEQSAWILGWFNDPKPGTSPDIYMEGLSDLKILSLAARKTLELPPENNIWQQIDTRMEQFEDREQWKGLVHIAYIAKTLFPKKFQTHKTTINNWDVIMDDFNNKLTKKLMPLGMQYQYLSVAEYAAHLRLLYPDKFPDEHLKKNIWEICNNGLAMRKTTEEWNSYAEMASFLKILFPERFKEIKFDDTSWKGIQQELSKSKDIHNAPWIYGSIAQSMAIITALDVNFGEKNYKLDGQRIPERRRF